MAVNRTVRRGLLVVAAGLGIIAIAGFIALTRVPGGIGQVRFRHALTAGEVHYTVPNEVLQSGVAAGLPSTVAVTPSLAVDLHDLQFVRDPDPSFLRYEISFDLHATASGQPSLPSGRATLRARLKFDRAAGTVALTKVDLVTITGLGNDPFAQTLLPALVGRVAATTLEGEVVYALPTGGGFWQRTGVAHVRDVRIEGGEIVVVFGL